MCRGETSAKWLTCQTTYLKTLARLRQAHRVPIIIAGDLFDKWNASPEAINAFLDGFSQNQNTGVYAVKGNHDVPYGNVELTSKSAYDVLHKTNAIVNLSTKPHSLGGELLVAGFGHGATGFNSVSSGDRRKYKVRLAVIHRYTHDEEHCYPGAKPEDHVRVLEEKLIAEGYNCAVVGDNHKGFLYEGKIPILNSGTLLRRRSDEISYQPCFGVLYENASIERVPLDCHYDVFAVGASGLASSVVPNEAVGEFLEVLESLGGSFTKFADLVRRYCQTPDVHPKVKELMLESLEAGEK